MNILKYGINALKKATGIRLEMSLFEIYKGETLMSIKKYINKKTVVETAKYIGSLVVVFVCKYLGGRKI